MSLPNELTCSLSKLSLSPIVTELETSLQQNLVKFRELVIGFEQLFRESEGYRTELLAQKQKCDSKCCSSAEDLKNVIVAKDNIIQLAASTLTKLNDTKNCTILNEVFRILCGETVACPLINNDKIKCEIDSENTPVKISKVLKQSVSPKESPIEDVSFKDDSVSEIEGTPGRKSPVIPSKVVRVPTISTTDSRRRKKEDLPTPKNKSTKLVFTNKIGSKRSGGLVQSRFCIVESKSTTVVDLTSSPEFSGGNRSVSEKTSVQKLIKKESSDNDDTILPSPTSASNKLFPFKLPKDKLKMPLSLNKAKVKTEPMDVTDIATDLENVPLGTGCDNADNKRPVDDITEMEESINILKPKRFRKQSPIKTEPDEAYDTDASVSLLAHVSRLQDNHIGNGLQATSPPKLPLAVNINITNMPSQSDADNSMSLLQQPSNKMAAGDDNVKRRTPEKVEPVYKEPTVRKKAEKRALPAWCCDECKKFFGQLYGSDAASIEKVVAQCSKHRGRSRPAPLGAPQGFWDTRWDVPQDTEEFNRRNNV